jgi:hypothetical protein
MYIYYSILSPLQISVKKSVKMQMWKEPATFPTLTV